ncbi:S8 family serine peptidase [Fibrella aquatica]|uniref:S8 family serine peptidase n=1 Tax=Fibrella aquatica TaxID=3242487 RepID=UPI0035228394
MCSIPGLAQKIDSNYVDGEIYIKVKRLTNPTEVKTNSSVNLTSELPFLAKYASKYSLAGAQQSFYFARTQTIRQVYRIRLADPKMVAKFIEDMSRESDVVYAEPVPLMRVRVIPNDPAVASQQYGLNRIAAYEAWNVSQGNATIKIAICDNAIDTNHPDLVGNLLPGYDVANGDTNPNPPDVTMNHGTHVAGIAGAVTNNSIGIASLGFNKIKLIPVKSTRDDAGPSSITHAYEGVVWASQNGANIINTSWGGGAFSQTAQDIANDVFNRGIIWIASAGNSASTLPSYPAALNNIISVVSTNSTDARSSFSNYGTTVDLCAPGDAIYSSLPANTYGTFSGTSMASPLAASVFGYVWSINPTLTATQLINLIKSTCDNIDAQNPGETGLLGSGRVNALRAALQACPNPAPIAISPAGSSVICEGTSVTLTATSLANGTYQWTKDNLFVGGNATTLVVNETGSYGVVFQGADGCPSSATAVNVTVVPQTLMISTSKQPVLCNADSVVLTVPVMSGVPVEWRRDGALLANATNRYVASMPGTYTARLDVPGSGCAITSDPLVVERILVDTQVTAGGNTQLCPGQRVDLQVAAAAGAAYQWRRGTTFVGSNSNVLPVTTSGTYLVTITSGFCSFTSAQTLVSVLPATLSIATTRPTTFCLGDSTGLRTTDVAGVSYFWRRNGQHISGVTSASYTARDAGEYTVGASFTFCSTTSPAISVSVPVYRVGINAPQTVACLGTVVSLSATVSPTPAGVTYQWYLGGNAINAATSSVYSTTQSGSYTVRIQASNCQAQSSASTISFYATQTTAPVVHNTSFCGGDPSASVSGTLVATTVACPAGLTQTATYTGGTVGYDNGYSSGADPSVTITNTSGAIQLEVSITWEKKDGYYETSCGSPHEGGSPFNSETQFRLRSPQGTIITLIPGSFLGGDYGGVVTTVFRDGATPITAGSRPTSGIFSPTQPLATFNSENPTGVWTLLPTDLSGADPLCVSGFSVKVVSPGGGGNSPSAVSWWSAPTGGTLLGTGAAYSPVSLSNASQTVYAQGLCAGMCPSLRVAATLTYSPMRSLQSGNWTNPATWTCGRIPTASDVVHIEAGHTVTVNQPGQAAKRVVDRGGRVYVPNNMALRINQ